MHPTTVPQHQHLPGCLDGVVPSPRLTGSQRALVGSWFPHAGLVADLCWNQVDTVVLHLRCGAGEVVVKTAGPQNHHVRREIAAHRSGALAPWGGRVPALSHADEGENVVATRYLPGVLVDREPHLRDDPEMHRQAGRLLRQLHDRPGVVDAGYGHRLDTKALAWLDRPHRIPPTTVDTLREVLGAGDPGPSTLVPTHGDWQPRNWLWHEGEVRVIDLGRFEPRPAETDLVRLAHQHWREHPTLEDAFRVGYGGDPRGPSSWPRERLREAVGTACYAFAVGDARFEAQGHAMVDDALAAF